jgi:hypothetical protein
MITLATTRHLRKRGLTTIQITLTTPASHDLPIRDVGSTTRFVTQVSLRIATVPKAHPHKDPHHGIPTPRLPRRRVSPKRILRAERTHQNAVSCLRVCVRCSSRALCTDFKTSRGGKAIATHPAATSCPRKESDNAIHV